jgi:hypothetical protein
VTTPFSDDSVFPRLGPPVPPSSDGADYQLRSERALWERRAEVARDAAKELSAAKRLLSGSGRTNKLGECTEGRDVTKAVRSAIESLSAELTDQALRATALSEQCSSAVSSFEDVDARGAASIEQ